MMLYSFEFKKIFKENEYIIFYIEYYYIYNYIIYYYIEY